MRKVNEIIQKNAKREMLVAKARAEESGLVLTDRIFAGRMASFLPGLSVDSVKKGFDRYYHEGNTWRVDYLEAFAHSLFRDISWMVVSHTPKNVREGTAGEALWGAIGQRITLKETKRLIDLSHRLLDNPELFELCQNITTTILDSKDADQASLKVFDMIRSSEALDSKPLDLRGKKRNPKSRK